MFDFKEEPKLDFQLDFQEDEPSTGEKSLGILEAGASMVAGLPSQIAGGLHGVGALLSGKGVEGANQALESTMKSNFGFGEYVPSTKTGKKYAENLGSALNKPVEWAGNAGEFVGGDLGRLSGEVMAGTAMALIDPLVIGAAGKAAITKAGQSRKGKFDKAGMQEELKSVAEAPKQTFDFVQDDLFDSPTTFDVSKQQNQFQAEPGVWRTDENGIPIRADKSMEAANLEQPLQRNLFGDELGPALGQERSLTDAIDTMPKGKPRKDALALFDEPRTFNERTRKQGGGVLIGEEQKRLPIDVAWAAKDHDRSVTPNSTDLSALKEAIAKDGVKEPITITVSTKDGVGYVTDGNNRLTAAKELGLQDIPYKVETTNVAFRPDQLAKALPLDALGISPTQLETRIKSLEARQAEAWLNDFVSEKPIWVPKAQRGAIKIDWKDEKGLKQLKGIPGMDRRLKNILPDLSTPEEFFATHKTTPDVQQNMVQRGFNMLTKGGVYQSLKTDNPLIKRVVDRFLEADQRAKAATQEMVHEGLEKIARKLNDNEKADVWAALKIAESSKRPLTEDMMARYGLNEKQIEYAVTHQNVMGEMFEKLKASMEAAGLKPVSPQVAYVASRARGDFRRLVYKDGDIVGIFGANTKLGLKKDIEKFEKDNKGFTMGEERYFGGQGKNGTSEGFNQMLEFLAQNDPAIKQFVDKVNEQAQKDAFEYMNAKTHTMQKKGIFGMEGNRPGVDAITNAKEGMRAQVRYAETMIKWSELSKAVKDTKELVGPENGLDMPNAKTYLKDYIDSALGRNPTELGRALDGLTAAMGKSTGLGTTIGSKVMTGAKQVTNGILLGLNPMFLLANAVQPLKVMPEMSAWLKSMGLDKNFDVGTGYSYLAKGGMDVIKADMKMKVDPIIKEAMEYGEARHVYASDLFETGGDVSKGAHYYGNKITQTGAAQIEHVTRKSMYLGFVRMLHENGITPKQGLFEAAQKVTDLAMNNYSHQEAPMAYNAMGGAGRAAYNLMSYKHNELSRLSMFVRDVKMDASAKPLLINLASQIAFAGVRGTILYAEANELTKLITAKLGKPTSLTKLLLDSDMSKFFHSGMFSAVGADMTNRLGMSVFPGSVTDAVMPGAGKLVDIGASAVELAKNPNEYNAKNLARDVAPGGFAGPMDRAWFSPENAKGEELALNRNKVQATAVRNQADKAWKSIGGTGLNESLQKTKSYENTQIEKAYSDKRMNVLNNIGKEFYTSGKVPAALIEKYIKYQGDPSTLPREIERMATEQKIDAPTLKLMRDAAGSSLSNAYKLQRVNP